MNLPVSGYSLNPLVAAGLGAAAGLEVWAIEDKKWGVDQSQAQRKIQSLADLLENLNNR